MLEQGIVEKIKGGLAFVRIERTAKCEGCRACAFGGKKSLVLPSVMKTACSAGDRVILEMPERSFAGASLLLFIVPLMLMLVGFLSGFRLGEPYMLAFGFSFAAAGAAVSVIIDRSRRFNPKYSPTVVEKITNE